MKKFGKVTLIVIAFLIIGILLLSWLTTSVEPFKSFTQLSTEEAGDLGAEHGKDLKDELKNIISK